MNQFRLWNASATICNHFQMSFGPNQPWSCLFLVNIGGQLGRKCCGWLKMPCTIPIPVVMLLACEPILTLECFCSCLQSCAHVIWVRVASELVIYAKFGGQLGSKWRVWMKTPCTILIQSSIDLFMNQFWLWSVSEAVCNHVYMWFGPNQPWSCSVLAKTGGQLSRICCDWLKMQCTIPIPGFVINVCELNLTLEYFWSSLQWCTHVIWANIALKLFVFGQIWGLAWHSIVCLDEKGNV